MLVRRDGVTTDQRRGVQPVVPVRPGPGDVAVLCGGTPYVIADEPATEPDVVVRAGGRCTSVHGDDLVPPVSGVGAWGTARPDSTVPLNGLYTVDSGMSRPLRAWFTSPRAPVPSWYLAHSDPVVGSALRLLHADPGRPWTLAALAAETSASRASLARRFTALVGQPPMTCLREWRLARAADLLREPDTTLAAVASRAGFSTAFALSAAFKRARGMSPSEYRVAANRS